MAYTSGPHKYASGSDIFECPAVAKYVSVVTTHKGHLACGHCLAYLHDPEGNKIPVGPLTVHELYVKDPVKFAGRRKDEPNYYKGETCGKQVEV